MALLSRCLQCKMNTNLWIDPSVYNLNWPIFLMMSTNQIWHFVLCWTGETWEWSVVSTIHHRWRSNMIVWNCQFAMTSLSRCFQSEGSTNLWINESFWQFQQNKFDTLCCAEPVQPESGQYPTTQTKVSLDFTINQPKIRSWTNNRQAMLGNIWET